MSRFLRRILPMLAVLFVAEVQAQNFWTDVAAGSFDAANSKRLIKPDNFRAFTVDTLALKAALRNAPLEFTPAAEASPLILTLPMPDGSTSRFAVVETKMMEAVLAAQFPNIKTYGGQGIDDRTATLKMDWTDFGLHIQVLSPLNKGNYYVDPYAQGEKTQYMVYYKKDLAKTNNYTEEPVLDAQAITSNSGYASRTAAGPCYGGTLRTYRIAVATTGEYAVAVGASTVSSLLSSVTTTVNRVSGIYEKEVAIRLTLVGNNSAILFTNGSTDPFTGNNNANTLINESQTVIDANIGTSNYDIGHTLSTGTAGLAGLGVVCTGSKANGVTGIGFPVGDAYDVDYVAHEIGHQFGGNHTFNAVTGSCSGNRNAGTSVEPGSGVTIMAYAGICGTNDLQAHSIPFFHATSQQEINTFITSGAGSFCGTPTSTGNAIPVVNAGSNYTIPKATPFVLTGSATDANNSEVLTYSWEEIDPGTSSGDWNSGSKPFFRSFNPTVTPVRYFPNLADIAAGAASSPVIGEFLPNNAQTLNFRLTARDNRSGGGGVCSGDMIVTVNAASGPFQVSSQWGNENWTAGDSRTIMWDVAGTTAAPINCVNVSILFSADGGLTFPYTLVASTPNNGSATITVPNLKTFKGRIMVKAVGNIFFAMNTADQTVSSPCGAVGATITPAANVSAQAGTSALNLNLAPLYGSFTPSATFDGTEPQTDLAVRNTSTNACVRFINRSRYHSYTFTVSTTGTYTFAFSVPNPQVQAAIYTNSFSETNACTNLLVRTASYPGSGAITFASSMNASLSAGTTYVLVVSTFDNATPALPYTYRINITGPGTASQTGQANYTNPGAGYNYAYVVVRNSTGNIVAINSTADLSNSTTFPAGQYTVYGLSYSTSISNLNTYVGGSFNALATQVLNNPATFCADLSKNAVIVNATGTFPVQFTALKARKQGEKVALDWGTASEQNSNHFIVQRSANGADFDAQIGTVKAAGNSNTQLNYNLFDASPLKGWNYYRIKQVDVDGRFSYSNTAAVNFEKGSGLMIIYPNPAKDQLNVEYTATRAGRLELQVIDSKGAVLKANKISVTTGRNLETINISSLAQGMYLLKYIDADGNIAYIKFIKQ